jgi:hypothetical protein
MSKAGLNAEDYCSLLVHIKHCAVIRTHSRCPVIIFILFEILNSNCKIQKLCFERGQGYLSAHFINLVKEGAATAAHCASSSATVQLSFRHKYLCIIL